MFLSIAYIYISFNSKLNRMNLGEENESQQSDTIRFKMTSYTCCVGCLFLFCISVILILFFHCPCLPFSDELGITFLIICTKYIETMAIVRIKNSKKSKMIKGKKNSFQGFTRAKGIK